jgi:hypothetical protein
MITKAGRAELPGGQQNGGHDVDDESEESENVGVNFRESQSADDQENYFVARDADRAGVCHAGRPLSILARNTLMQGRREW